MVIFECKNITDKFHLNGAPECITVELILNLIYLFSYVYKNGLLTSILLACLICQRSVFFLVEDGFWKKQDTLIN
jgi:hypothetical protein